MWFVVLVALWWHCRSAWAVFRVGGMVDPAPESPLSSYLQAPGLVGYFSRYFLQDRDVFVVTLCYTDADDRSLVHLRRFPKLRHAWLDAGQIGPGLQNLQDLPDLTSLTVYGMHRKVGGGMIEPINSIISARHFLLAPRLNYLTLIDFSDRISDLEQLKQHPNLRSLSLSKISYLTDVLHEIESCENIKSLFVESSHLDQEGIASICRMSHLKTLILYKTGNSDNLDEQLRKSLPRTDIEWQPFIDWPRDDIEGM
jgi:hypothetical protein